MTVALTLHIPCPYLFTRSHFQHLAHKGGVSFLLSAEPHLLVAILYSHPDACPAQANSTTWATSTPTTATSTVYMLLLSIDVTILPARHAYREQDEPRLLIAPTLS